MIYMTVLHWVIVAVFVLLFLILVILSLKEKDMKTFTTMVISSLVLVAIGMSFSLFTLDKYTKIGKIVSWTKARDYRSESVIIRGKIKNEGKFKIGYCNVEIRMLNPISRNSKNVSYFTPTKSLGDLFGDKDIKSNVITEEFSAIKDLEPRKSKKFKIKMKFPSHFSNPKYKLKLFCH